MKHKVGERVRVRGDLKIGGKFTRGMSRYSGKIVTIFSLCFDGNGDYTIKEDDQMYYWYEEMFEPANRYRVGDYVKIRDDLEPYVNYGGLTMYVQMMEMRGQKYYIKSISKEGIYKLDCGWNVTNEMIEKRELEIQTLGVKIIKDRKENKMKDFKIVDYKVFTDNDGNPRALKVFFEDGAIISAECEKEDKFDLLHGIEICVMKYQLGSEFNKTVNKAYRQIEAIDKAKEEARVEKERISAKQAKNAAKRVKREQRRKVKEEACKIKARQERIFEMSEAIVEAFTKMAGMTSCECNCNKNEDDGK